MSHTHTGSATSIGPSGTVQITSPDDGDSLTAASNNLGAEKLADYVKELFDRTLFKDVAVAASVRQTLDKGVRLGDSSHGAFILGNEPTASKFACVLEQNTDASGKVRLFVGTTNRQGIFATINAGWDEGAAQWSRDIAGNAYMLHFDGDVSVRYYPGGSASPWADGSWPARSFWWSLSDNTTNGKVMSTDGTTSQLRAIIPRLSWIDATGILNAGWITGAGQLVRYRLDALGRVEVDGAPEITVGSKADGSVLFTLPAGWRPDRTYWGPLNIANSTTFAGTTAYQWEFQAGGDVVLRLRGFGASPAALVVGFIPLVYGFFPSA